MSEINNVKVSVYDIEKYAELLVDKNILLIGEDESTGKIFDILSHEFENHTSCKSVTWPKVCVLLDRVAKSDKGEMISTVVRVADKKLNDGRAFVDMFLSDYMDGPINEADIVIVTGGCGMEANSKIVKYLIGMRKQFMVRTPLSLVMEPDIFQCIKLNEVWVGTYGASVERTRKKIERAVWQEEMTIEDLDESYCWMTNIEHTRSHESGIFRTMAENLSENKELIEYLERDYGEVEYHRYENLDDTFIDVPVLSAVPTDFDGCMGVPVEFLVTYDPERFDIVSFMKGSSSFINTGKNEPVFVKGSGSNRRVGARLIIKRKK